ncbi:hypothetical protein [Actinomyces succiniciruminis]|uniref:Uncharacterized protein n=1 Tax=Actinomyces succiniciruminis TaxID=1522002 RepID=A0A1L7RBB8_9ACTO|nr:hypothetical protein [Actinomyces succiniciruminis]CED91165.1 Hypothetical protein AAM4_1333 [Actinomyces succiniciruminis]
MLRLSAAEITDSPNGEQRSGQHTAAASAAMGESPFNMHTVAHPAPP